MIKKSALFLHYKKGASMSNVHYGATHWPTHKTIRKNDITLMTVAEHSFQTCMHTVHAFIYELSFYVRCPSSCTCVNVIC